jgi:hypothetical protein
MYTKLSRTADRIEAVLRERHAPATVVGGKVMPGFIEMLLRPAPGTKVNQVKALQADIALAVGKSNVRIAQSGTHLRSRSPGNRVNPCACQTCWTSWATSPGTPLYSACQKMAPHYGAVVGAGCRPHADRRHDRLR